MSDGFLKKAYAARDASSTRKLYNDWAETYEAEVAENGYATPDRCAAALAEFSDDLSAPILDFGCGTGLSGLALKRAGFKTVDGVDLSEDMLQQASSKDVYRSVELIEADASLDVDPGTYDAVAAIGVIGAGAAPISVLHTLMHGLGRRGKLVLSFNDHALEDPANEAGLNEWLDCGAAHLLFKEYGPHIPGINLNANVYVIEKN